MQKYLAMDDFLVLMWMRQQPAMAEIAKMSAGIRTVLRGA